MSNMFSDMNLTPEETAAAESLIGFNLQVPASVGRDGKGYARWNEIGVVEGAFREDKPGTEGQVRKQFTAKVKIVPAGADSINVGKVKLERMLVNFGALKGVKGAEGAGSLDDEKGMSARSIKKIKQLAVAAGLDLSAGVTGMVLDALFPIENTTPSVLLGTRLALSMSDGPNKKRPEYGNNQNVDNFLRIEG
jgi:hypothetical protein